MNHLPRLDPKLFFEMDHCEARHYLFGNAHTFPGRILAWCEKKEGSFFISKSDIINPTEPVKYWIEGFLRGNEPTPPKDAEGRNDSNPKLISNWRKKVKKLS